MNKDTVMRMYRSSLWLTVVFATWCCTPMLGIAVAQYPGPDAGIFEQPAGEAVTVPGATAQAVPDAAAQGSGYAATQMDAGTMMTAPPGGPTFDQNSMYYPQNSPYQHNYDSTYNLKGMWFNDSNNYPRKYEFSLEYLNASLFSPGSDLVGDREAFLLDPHHVALTTGQNNPFVTYNVSHLAPETSNAMRGIGTHGMRARFDIINPDDRILMTDIFGVLPADSEWRPKPRADLTSFAKAAASISAMGTIPFDNGIDSGATGAAAEFDGEYKLGYHSSVVGANVDWSPNAFLDKGPLKIRTLYGLTFARVAEEFTFDGVQTNFGYTVDVDTGDIDDGTVVDIGNAFTYSNMYSRSTSYVAGPEIGLRYDLGGDRLKFWGVTKAGIGVNNETIRLGGNNMYDSFQRSIDGLDPNLTPTVANPNPGAFASQERHTHISPIFQQQLFAEAPIFQYVPYLGKMHLFRDASFRVGYNFLLIGEMARPTKSIEYREYEPKIDINRSRWAMGATSFAIDWKY